MCAWLQGYLILRAELRASCTLAKHSTLLAPTFLSSCWVGWGDDFWDRVSLYRSFWVSWNLLCRQNLKDLRASTSWVMGLNDYATTPSNPYNFFCFQKGSGFILCSPGSPWPFVLPVSVSQGAGIRLVTEQAQMCRFYRYCYDFSPTDCTVLGRVGSQRTAPLQCCAAPEQTLGLGELISLLVSLSWQ